MEGRFGESDRTIWGRMRAQTNKFAPWGLALGGACAPVSGAVTQTFRHPDILEIARRDGRVSVDGLASHFGVTAQTIRRDLAELAEAGKLERVHGGAILPSGVSNYGYDARRAMAAEQKAAIAAACAADIPDDASVFLGIGTTTEAVARALSRHRNLLVVTNNLHVAGILHEGSEAQIVLAGGALRRADWGLVGALTLRTIEQFKFDVAVLGCSALDEDGDLLDFDIQEVGVSQAIIGCARRTFLVADATKFERAAPVRVASLKEISRFYTDRPVPGPVQERCEAWGTEVRVAATGG